MNFAPWEFCLSPPSGAARLRVLSAWPGTIYETTGKRIKTDQSAAQRMVDKAQSFH